MGRTDNPSPVDSIQRGEPVEFTRLHKRYIETTEKFLKDLKELKSEQVDATERFLKDLKSLSESER